MVVTPLLALWGIAASSIPLASTSSSLYSRDPSISRFRDVPRRGCVPKTVGMHLELTWKKISPDGYSRHVVLMNGQYPGPLLELCQGDNVEFLVKNKTPFNETIHFHGIEQLHTPWSDGVPGVSQYPIAPGKEFLYKWRATEYGTYWYHAHVKSHVSDGLYGPILIHPSAGQTKASFHSALLTRSTTDPSLKPFRKITGRRADVDAMLKAEHDPKIVMVSDWSHFTSAEFLKISKEVNLDVFCVDSVSPGCHVFASATISDKTW